MRNEFISLLSRVLEGSISIDDFQEWLLAHLQEILDSGDDVASAVADELDANLVLLGEELFSERDLFESVNAAISRLETTIIEPEPHPMFLDRSDSADNSVLVECAEERTANFNVAVG